MSEFTKGPWVKTKYGQLYGPDGKQIEVYNLGVAMTSHSGVSDSASANTALMIAAPDMYEALKSALDEINQMKPTSPLVSVSLLVRAAIAKAEGVQ